MAGATERKKASILRAARVLYAERGVRGTSIEAIAESAGVSRQSVYTYYGTKEQILAEVLGQFLHEGTTSWREDGRELGEFSSLAQLERELGAFMTIATGMLMQPEYLDVMRLVVGETKRNPLVGTMFRNAVPDALMGLAKGVFQRIPEQHRAPVDQGALLRVTIGSLLPHVLLDGLLASDAVRKPTTRELRALARVVAAAAWV